MTQNMSVKSRPFFTFILQKSLFKLPEYQAGFGADALELFRPSKERNKLLLRTCALLVSLAGSFSPACVAGIIVEDRTKPAPRVGGAVLAGVKEPDL